MVVSVYLYENKLEFVGLLLRCYHVQILARWVWHCKMFRSVIGLKTADHIYERCLQVSLDHCSVDY